MYFDISTIFSTFYSLVTIQPIARRLLGFTSILLRNSFGVWLYFQMGKKKIKENAISRKSERMVYPWYLRFRVLEDCWQGLLFWQSFLMLSHCSLPLVSLGFIANGLCLLMGLLKLVSAPTTPRSCKAPAEHNDLFTDAALPNQGQMAWETCLNICKSGVHISSALTQALLFQKKRRKKK